MTFILVLNGHIFNLNPKGVGQIAGHMNYMKCLKTMVYHIIMS